MGQANPTTTRHSPSTLGGCFERLQARLSPEALLRRDEPLAKRTTMRVGGPADLYVEPASEADLAEILRAAAAHSLPVLLLGRGSNLLVRDGGVRGVVVSLGHAGFSRIEVQQELLLCGAGARLKAIANTARQCGLGGLEFLEGIPGTLGGALRMNAGAMGAWTFERVLSLRVMDRAGQARDVTAAEAGAEYRGSALLKDHIALAATLKGTSAPEAAIRGRMEEYSRKRWASQPPQPSAGCIFKNPPAVPAGKLIDQLGLKGLRVGGAVVSEVHGNFIVNDGQATASDVLDLVALIRQKAQAAMGIDLQTEVEIVGEDRPQ